MKRKLGILILILLLLTISGCRNKEDVSSNTPNITLPTIPTTSASETTPQSTLLPNPTATPDSTVIPECTATPQPAETIVPNRTSYTFVEREPEEITYNLEKIIPLEGGYDDSGHYMLYEDCIIGEKEFFIIYSCDNENYRIERYDFAGNLLDTTYQTQEKDLPVAFSPNECLWYDESYVLNVSDSEQTLTPLMGMQESYLSEADTYYMGFLGSAGTDGMLFYSVKSHFPIDIRLFKKAEPQNITYTCTLGIISSSARQEFYMVAEYNLHHPDNRVKVINYREEGMTYEQAFEKLRADLTTSQGPDLLVLSKAELENLYQENLLTDLNTEPTLLTEDIFPGVRDYLSLDGSLFALSPSVRSKGLIIASEYTSELAGKSFREMYEWSAQNDADLFCGYERPYELLSLMIDLDMDEYIDLNRNTCSFGEDFMTNLNYIAQYNYSEEYTPKKLHVEGITNMAGTVAGTELFVDDENYDVIGFTHVSGGPLLIGGGQYCALSKNAGHREAAISFLNWDLSGTSQITDIHDDDDYALPPTISGCLKQQEHFSLRWSEWGLPENTGIMASEKLIEYLKQSRVPILSEEEENALSQIIFEEAMTFLDGNLTVQQATENIRLRVQTILDNR